MAVKWNKIYRGGVQRTTPETREVNAPTTGSMLPGTAVTLTDAADQMTTQKGVSGVRDFFYLVGEQMHGSVDDDQVVAEGERSSMRLYTPQSGELFAGRAVAGLAITDDLPLTIDGDGRFAAATAGEDATAIHAYVDAPRHAYPGTETPTVLDQLIPIKIK